jgi:integrase
MLNDKAIRNAKATDRDYKLADSGGLYLFVTTKGHKSWRLKYRFDGKEKRLVFGGYPDVSLAEARGLRDDARKLLREGRDPSVEARKRKLVNIARHRHTFEKVARDWHAEQKARWKPIHAMDVISSLERDAFPILGALPITDIDKPTLLAVLKPVQARGAIETAHRLLQRVAAIFNYAGGAGLVEGNPAIGMKASLAPVPVGKRWPALTEIDEIQKLIAAVDEAPASPVTRLASRFMALTAQRPGMIRSASWVEFEGIDWDDPSSSVTNALWRVSAARMKQVLELREDEAFEHLVPLSRHAVDVLRAMRRLSGGGPMVFPSHRSSREPLSENAVGYLYNRLGYKGRHVPHGWRSAFSTVMNSLAERSQPGSDRLIIDRLIIDLMLAHTPSGMSEAERLYNRAAYMERRRELAQSWADRIMAGLAPADVLIEGLRRSRSNAR